MIESESMEIRREDRSGATILSPVGEIDLSRSPSLRAMLIETLDESPARLVLDLGEVSYMDSSGVATFIEAMHVARQRSCALILCALQDRVRSIFEIARLDMVFTIKPDTDAALAE